MMIDMTIYAGRSDMAEYRFPVTSRAVNRGVSPIEPEPGFVMAEVELVTKLLP
jgi:hypothetical protein